MKKSVIALLLVTLISINSHADSISLGGDDDIESILSAHKDKTVTVVFESGYEMTGKVAGVSDDALHLMALSGKEFYDAVINTDEIAAVVIRVRNQ